MSGGRDQAQEHPVRAPRLPGDVMLNTQALRVWREPADGVLEQPEVRAMLRVPGGRLEPPDAGLRPPMPPT